MKEIPTRDGQPIRSWCKDLDNTTILQVVDLAQHPEVVFVALMPDAHAGYGMPIGGVIATENSLIPNAVGVDIGCGMCAVQTDVLVRDVHKKQLQDIIRDINTTIPMGFNAHGRDQEWDGFKDAPDVGIINEVMPIARRQLGTLGGGNHFIEIQSDIYDRLWVMLHSGSRRLGHAIASYYHKQAKEFCNRWHSNCVDELAFLPWGELATVEYYAALKFAQDYAQANRAHMMQVVKEIIEDNLAHVPRVELEVNIHHNFAQKEHHMGRNVWVHRKGATQAQEGQLGIIPGSMGTQSYIVRGKGHVLSYESCSHGAGRRMGRKEFCRTYDLDAVNDSIRHVVFEGWKTDRKGNVEFSEAPAAYKDIDEVIEAQADLVDIEYKLVPLGVAKG